MRGRKPPDGAIRRSQLLTGSGPGALVDLVEHAVIVGGLEAWRYSHDGDGWISEPRLREKALRMLEQAPWWNGEDIRLRCPPSCDSDQPSQAQGIQVARFPGWYLCQNIACQSVVHWKDLDKKSKHICSREKKTAFPVTPIRFVTACPNGHIQDIDWLGWVHTWKRPEGLQGAGYCVRGATSQRNNDPLGQDFRSDLYMIQRGTSGELTDYAVGCRACGKTRGLQDLAAEGALGSCPGWRPWLGPGTRETSCDQNVRLLTRTASNAYFAQVISALSIPDPAENVRKQVEEVWSILQAATPEDLPVFRRIPQVASALEGITDAEVLAEVHRRVEGLAIEVPRTRETEWNALMKAPYGQPGDHPQEDETWFARRLQTDLPPFLDRVVLVHHLREVRAQVGFTRIDGVTGDEEGEYSLDVRTAPLGIDISWLPAVEILGEGVFLGFDLQAVRDWEARGGVRRRRDLFKKAAFDYNGRNPKRQVPFFGPRLVMLHTLAHMLINSISLECGYPATSIRERIYCWRDRPDGDRGAAYDRAGILLYTGTPGSEGTLGGLVEIGRDIVKHLRHAAHTGRLCSNDPVCAQHEPQDSQQRHREGAACHGCVLIGEPSCERMNRDLDRSFVVPTVHDREAAFLGPWMATWS